MTGLYPVDDSFWGDIAVLAGLENRKNFIHERSLH
jgi:hypothetical protein